MNNICLIGRPTSDLEKKTTTSGKSVCSFSLAVKRPFTKDITDFIPLTVWDKKADTMCQWVKKGQLIGISGCLTSRKYTDKDGNNRTAFEVNVNDFYFCESKKSADVSVEADPLPSFESKMNSMGMGQPQKKTSEIDNFFDDEPF